MNPYAGNDILLEHAYRYAWCNPGQDLQYVIRPARLSGPLGALADAPHIWGSVRLPNMTHRFHVFQIGQVYPEILGLLPRPNDWMRISELMGVESLILDLYTYAGLMIPRFKSWIMITPKKDVIIAVEDIPEIADLSDEPLYVRFYSNAYFQSRRKGETERIYCQGVRTETPQLANQFIRVYNQFRSRDGHCWLYRNGKLTNQYNTTHYQYGDYLEMVYDSSVKAVKTFAVQQLDTFVSSKDQLRKYLLTYPGDQTPGPMIDYRDDIELYVTNHPTRYTGVYYHHNEDTWMCQVTHRDYSIPVGKVREHAVQGMLETTNPERLYIQMFIRDSGYQRPLIHEAHRLHELYKLPFRLRKGAMIGQDPLNGVWDADTLESSAYMQILSANGGTIEHETVQEAYGYNSMSRLMAGSPLPLEYDNGQYSVQLPPGLWRQSSIFEYDVDGRWIGFNRHRESPRHVRWSSRATMIVGLPGLAGESMGDFHGYYPNQGNLSFMEIQPDEENRFYNAPIVNGKIDHSKWTDVTGDTTKYSIVDRRVVWLTDPKKVAVCRRSDRFFLMYRQSLKRNQGVYAFTVRSSENYAPHMAQPHEEKEALTGTFDRNDILHIPPGRIDVILNGYTLIENVDFVVRWPQVVICNKEHLVDGDVQDVWVRCHGHCRSDMTRYPLAEVEWVRYNRLSKDSEFDVRDDKLQEIVVRGRLYHRDQLGFSEDNTLVNPSIINGSPYRVHDTLIRLPFLTGTKDSWTYMQEAKARDQLISGYLTQRLPEPPQKYPDQIRDLYPIYSPWTSAVLHALLSGRIDMSAFEGQYSDQKVYDALQRYRWLLEFDPVKLGWSRDHLYVHPHEYRQIEELDIYQYTFLERAIHVYLNGGVDLTAFIRLKPTWLD